MNFSYKLPKDFNERFNNPAKELVRCESFICRRGEFIVNGRCSFMDFLDTVDIPQNILTISLPREKYKLTAGCYQCRNTITSQKCACPKTNALYCSKACQIETFNRIRYGTCNQCNTVITCKERFCTCSSCTSKHKDQRKKYCSTPCQREAWNAGHKDESSSKA